MFQPTHILVVKSGWVFAAVIPDWEPGKDIRTMQARVIRTWGTTDGLAQLAISGPTESTVLEPVCIVTVPAGEVLFAIEVKSSGWK